MNKTLFFCAITSVLLTASVEGIARQATEAGVETANAAALASLTGVTLQCRVQRQGSAYLPAYQPGYCVAAEAGSTYNVWYQVFAPAGPSPLE